MLTELQVSNFAIIEEQTISFAPGLNVLSGETGAGKSIILEALKLILGGRGSAEFIRAGADELEVQALFCLASVPASILDSLPEDIREAGGQAQELLLSRRLTRSGKGKVLINGRLGTVALLQEIGSRLLSVCSQNQFIRLFEPAYHLELVDGFAGNGALLEVYAEKFQLWRMLRAELQELDRRLSQNLLRRAELQHIVNELAGLELRSGVREELEREVRVGSNAEKLLSNGARVGELLNGDAGVFEQLRALHTEVKQLAQIDGELSPLLQQLQAGEDKLSEFDQAFAYYIDRLEVNQEQLNHTRERLSKIAQFERKFKTNSAGLVSLLDEAMKELSWIDDPAHIEKLRMQEAALRNEVQVLGEKLHESRVKAGRLLSKRIGEDLSELSMPNTTLQVFIEQVEHTERGIDRLELLISTNAGEPKKPLRQIASGGELSRIMLVLKQVLKDRCGVHVLVFDEVDSGVSGSVARAVGENLKRLSVDSQVICITHLPQVASLAHRHLLVEKCVGKRAVTKVRTLDEKGRVDEIARMLAGYNVTAASRESARELLASNPIS